MIDYLKKYSLPFGLRKSIKENKARGPSLSYKEAKRILLFFTSEGNQKMALITNLRNKFEKEGKNVQCIYLIMDKEDMPDVGLDDGMVKITLEDFSLFGKVENAVVKELLDEEFDFMIHADVESNIYTDIIISNARAKCRIGNYTEGRNNQYDMMVGIPSGKGANFLLDQIYYYIKRL
jgi:hypothetical protein